MQRKSKIVMLMIFFSTRLQITNSNVLIVMCQYISITLLLLYVTVLMLSIIFIVFTSPSVLHLLHLSVISRIL